MKKKTAAILSSCAAIAVCSSLIVGSTYALFTSESKVNIAVTSGKVDVEASIGDLKTTSTLSDWVSDGAFENGGAASVNQNEIVLDKVTPGDTVEIPVSVTNNSNVSILYRTKVVLNAGDYLTGALEVSVDDDEAYESVVSYTSAWKEWTEGDVATVTVAMSEDAGNEYQGLTTSISLAVEAVQSNAAKAGEGKEVKTATTVSAVEDLKAALTEGGIIVLDSDLTVEGTLNITADTTLDLNGKTITRTENKGSANHLFVVDEDATATIKNGTVIDKHEAVVENNKEVYKAWGYVISNHGELTINGLNIESAGNLSSALCNFSNSKDKIAKLTILGGTYVGVDMITLKCDRWSETYIKGGTIVTHANNNILCYAKLVIDDGEFISTNGSKVPLIVSSGYYKDNDSTYKADVTINGGRFVGNYLLVCNGSGFSSKVDGNTQVEINGGVFDCFVGAALSGGEHGAKDNLIVNGGTFNGGLADWATDNR